MLAERLNKDWKATLGLRAIEPVMRFSEEGLVLGATLLASARSIRDGSIDPNEQRLRTLLTAAHLRTPQTTALVHLQKAADNWREGWDALAAMHLVLSRLDRLEEPEADAHRLFLADELLRAGVEAEAIMRAIGLSAAAPEAVRKYDADQPRVPAGSGRSSGQWTASNDGGPAAAVVGEGGPARSGGSPQVRSRTSPPRSREVTPDTITPAAGGHKATSDTGWIAMRDCMQHVAEAAVGERDNIKWKENWTFECIRSKNLYEKAEYAVETNPKVSGGIVGFPDGGLIIMRKGKDDVYIRAEYRDIIPPFKRAI